MSSDVFRFVTIRPPQQAASADAPTPVVELVEQTPSPLITALRKLRPTGTRGDLLAVASKFRSAGGFAGSSASLDKTLSSFVAKVQTLSVAAFWTDSQQAFSELFSTAPSAYVATPAYTQSVSQVTDSLLVAAMDSSVSPNVRLLLVRAVRALWLIRRMAEQDEVTWRDFNAAPLALPAGIFPLPVAGEDLRAQQKAQSDSNAAAVAARRKRLAQLATSLAANRQAIDELLKSLTQADSKAAASVASNASAATAPSKHPGIVLSDARVSGLSGATRATLASVGVPAGTVDVVRSVALLEQQAAAIARQLYADPAVSGKMVRLGNLFISEGAIRDGNFVLSDPGAGDIDGRLPGPCAPVTATPPADTQATVPAGHGEARVLGIADLMVLEQDLLRYQLGEIAHIENVLRSEVRSRKFKTTDTTKQTVTTETEVTEDKERDLSSTERFELQTESQTVITENASKQAGLTIHASYGPSVDATSNFNISSSTATQQSNSAASTYAREITTKAVERVQTHTLTRRTVTTINVVEESNKHAFDNTAGTADITGIYRYVDKIYRAQVINYGKRLMLEFIVPEPAAFLRYAYTHLPVGDAGLVKPAQPGYCLANGTSFVALQASDIEPDNYLYWASQYGAQDVSPPPPCLIIATGSKKSPDSMPTVGERIISSDLFDVTIADGYLCQSAFVNIYGETQSGLHRIVYQLQEQQGEYVEPTDDEVVYVLQPTPSLTVSVNSNGFHNYEVVVTAFCTLTDAKMQAWQLKTYASVMGAYNDAKSAYDQAVREATLQQSDTAYGGSNPDSNEILEQVELKKGCIALLTGQRFDLFDSMVGNVAPYGYPEIDFAEAHAEGPYIRMFEQSFEWNNMVYLFYPYFWGRKAEWPAISQLTDNDPLYAQFLRAGAARVQVPVRPGFEANVLTYLSTGEIWAGDGTVVRSGSDDALDLSIIDELKSQTGNNDVEGAGTLSVTQNSAAVTGNGTVFSSLDASRRIVIVGVTYVIASVQDAQSITLAAPYAAPSAQAVGYALGGRLVGQPWEIKLPTNLVKLDGSMAIS